MKRPIHLLTIVFGFLMLKKQVAFGILVALSLIVTLFFPSVAEASTSFRDVPNNHWANSSISYMSKHGLMTGYPNGTFRPNGDITRAEFVVVLNRIVGIQGASYPFADADQARWANNAIGGAVKAGIIVPREFGTNFEPNKPITRLEMARMVARVLALNPEYKEVLDTFKDLYNGDLPFTEWKQIRQADVPLIALTFGTGTITGYPDSSFGLQQKTNRAEASAILLRIIQNRNKKPTSFQFMNEMIEVATTGTNANAVTNELRKELKNYKGLEVDHFAFNFVTKRVYVIPLHNGVTSMYERKFLWDKKAIQAKNPNFSDPKLVTGVIATVGDMTFKQDAGSYFTSFGSRIYASGGNSFFYDEPLKRFGLDYMAPHTPTVVKKDTTRELVLYGSWGSADISATLYAHNSRHYYRMFFNEKNMYRN